MQGYIKPLREDLKNKSKTDLKSDTESKTKLAALKAATNISTMIKDIFHIPPRYKAEISLSWKQPSTIETVNIAVILAKVIVHFHQSLYIPPL